MKEPLPKQFSDFLIYQVCLEKRLQKHQIASLTCPKGNPKAQMPSLRIHGRYNGSVKSPTTPVSAAHVCAHAGPSTREQGPTSGQTLQLLPTANSSIIQGSVRAHLCRILPRWVLCRLCTVSQIFFFLIHGQSRDYEYSGLEFDLIQQQTLVFVWFSLGF